MKILRIENADIIIQDYAKDGQGKIIISDDWRGSFSYVWGAMGSKIVEFLCSINAGYFADKLCQNTYVFSAKNSVKAVRKFIREDLSYELPWYKFMEGQKEMREKLNELESCSSEDEFVIRMQSFVDNLDCFEMSFQKEKEFKATIRSTFETEPWHFIAQEQSQEYKWLYDLHGKLKDKLQTLKS